MLARPLALLLLLASSSPALADTELTLPLAGLGLQVPDADGVAYEVSATWSLAEGGTLFEGRDVVREMRGGLLHSTTWLSIGWFDAERCRRVLELAPIVDAWKLRGVSLWGARWAARGGIYRGGGNLDGAPVVTLCLERGEKKQVVVSHFPRAGDGALGRARLLAEVRKSALLSSLYRAVRSAATMVTAPARDPSVVNNGGIAARREVELLWIGAKMPLPDDGFIWIAGTDLRGVDVFERMAPALPELSLAIGRIDDPGAPCAKAFALLGGGAAPSAPLGLPPSWEAGPTALGPEHRSQAVCRAFPWGVLVGGVVSASRSADLSVVAPLLAAVAQAADTHARTASERAASAHEGALRALADGLSRLHIGVGRAPEVTTTRPTFIPAQRPFGGP